MSLYKISQAVDQALNSTNRSTREAISLLSEEDLFVPVYDISIRKDKERVLSKFKRFSQLGVVSVKDFRSNPDNIFTAHECLTILDGSLATKFTVQFNLFGGTLIGMGTEKHEEFLSKIDTLKVIGCFCLTEVGYGNNAVEMETTATYDEKTNEFVIDTPTIHSQKFWITNGAYHANHSVVFAQTYVKGKNEGINVFLIRIRNDDGSLAPGVDIDDMGMKMGLNGVDNARITLRNVRASKDSLLNRISNVDLKGNFSSLIEGRRARFIYAANKLLSGRLCIASMMISSQKLCLAITIKYAKNRLSTGKSGKSDTPIFNFQLFQNQIIPLFARTLVYNVSLLHIRKLYSDYTVNEEKFDASYKNEMIRLCCAIKPMICWHANIVGNICRERCGGQGFLSINVIESTISGAHSGITAEGDSSVLMQKVTKEYVEDYLKKVITLPQPKYSKEAHEKFDNILEVDILLSLLSHRENHLTEYLANLTMSNPGQIYENWMLNENENIQSLAMHYGKRFSAEAYLKSNLIQEKTQ